MIHKWWHAFVRKRTKPIAVEDAFKWKRRLSLAYGFLAWNAFGLVLYMAYQGKGDWAKYYGFKSDEDLAMSPGLSWANTLGIKNAKVIRISGFTKVDEYDIVDGEKKTAAVKEEKNENSEELSD